MTKLEEIWRNELTLKSDKWLPYFKVYEKHFSKYVGKAPVIVEVGVQGGGSIQMWRKYFGDDAKIYGIDIDPRISEHKEHYDSNVELFVGDQASPEFWDEFLKKVPEIDIFIDDGGHTSEQQMITLHKVFPHIKMGGVFLCEDTHTSYWMGLGNPQTFAMYCQIVSDFVNYEHVNGHKFEDMAKNYYGLYSTTVYNSMVVFEKEQPMPFVREVINENDRFK